MNDSTVNQAKERVVYGLFEAAYLLLERVQLVGLIPGKRVGFRYSDVNGEATQALDRWHQPNLMVQASHFISSYRAVQGLAFAAKRRD